MPLLSVAALVYEFPSREVMRTDRRQVCRSQTAQSATHAIIAVLLPILAYVI